MNTAAWKVLIVWMVLGGTFAAAQGEAGRGVARVSLLNGDVSVRRGDSGDWVAAALNAPLVVEDVLITGVRSRAEVQFDWANMIRVAPESEIRLAALDNERYMIQVARGLVTFRVERDSGADVELSTPSVSVRPVKKGSYRIHVRDSGESEITVRGGEAEVFTPTGSERLRNGRTMLARGTASDPEFRTVSAAGRDEWDRWNEDRDGYYSRSRGYRYAHSSVYGIEDLDHHGSWIYVAPYGYVWTPRVTVGWTPYYHGRWSWIDWYGWSWVSYEPWGWAPYHYGRWFYHRSRWCWWPGGMYTRHYWSPGLVAFIGWGGWSGFRVGLGIGHVGWVPLAPYEPYYPWYGHRYYGGYRNTTYIDNSVHIVSNTNIVNIYKNARVNNGIVAVNSSHFGQGGAANVRVNRNDLDRVDLVRGQLPVAPSRESLRVSDQRLEAAPARAAASRTEFFSRRPAPAVERVPFEEQQRGMEQVARRAFGDTPLRTADPGGARGGAAAAPARAEAPARGIANETTRTARPARSEARTGGPVLEPRSAPAAENNSGWRRVGEPARTEVQEAGPGDSWRRFGGAAPARVNPDPREAARPAPLTEAEPRAPESPRLEPAPRATQREESGNWRRFESGREAAPPAEPRRVEQPAPAPRQSEPLRMSEPRVETQPAPRATQRDESGNWRRFESGRGAAPAAEPRRVERPAPAARPSEAPRASEPRMTPQPAPERRSAPLRISPPIVRQREAPSRVEAPRAPAAPGGGDARQAPGGGRGGMSEGGGRREDPGPRTR